MQHNRLIKSYSHHTISKMRTFCYHQLTGNDIYLISLLFHMQ